jgi:hypothetical protein
MAMTTSLIRFWFVFESNVSSRAKLIPQVGVTAWTREDAELLVRERLFQLEGLPPILQIIEDVDVSQLDENHVHRNMSPPNLRGVWYPQGYQ